MNHGLRALCEIQTHSGAPSHWIYRPSADPRSRAPNRRIGLSEPPGDAFAIDQISSKGLTIPSMDWGRGFNGSLHAQCHQNNVTGLGQSVTKIRIGHEDVSGRSIMNDRAHEQVPDSETSGRAAPR